MAKDKAQAESGMDNWMRMASMGLTVLGPVINPVATRLGERLERGGKRKVTVDVEVPVSQLITIDQEDAAKSAFGGTLLEVKDQQPLSQETFVDRSSKLSQDLLARGGEVTRDLADRGSKASQKLLKRSQEARKELSKRGNKLNKELNKRSRRVAKELNKRSERVAKELSKRSRQASSQLSGRSGTFWTIFGFSVGLTAAAITAYVLIRQRAKQQQQLEEEQSFRISENGYSNTASTLSSAYASPEPIIQDLPTSAEERVSAVAIAEQEKATEQFAPADAVLVGVVSTSRYYPASTPLSELASSGNGNVDVIYFTSEDEAKVQGYTSGM